LDSEPLSPLCSSPSFLGLVLFCGTRGACRICFCFSGVTPDWLHRVLGPILFLRAITSLVPSCRFRVQVLPLPRPSPLMQFWLFFFFLAWHRRPFTILFFPLGGTALFFFFMPPSRAESLCCFPNFKDMFYAAWLQCSRA